MSHLFRWYGMQITVIVILLLLCALNIQTSARMGALDDRVQGELANLKTTQTALQDTAKCLDIGGTSVTNESTLRDESTPAIAKALEENTRQVRKLFDELSRLASRIQRQPFAPQPLASEPYPGSLPFAEDPVAPASIGLSSPMADPMQMARWRQEAAPETVEHVNSVLREHSELSRRKIAAETDSESPDPAVLRKIMEETRAAIASELEGVWPANGPAGVHVEPAGLTDR